jgi:hypothetical protein
VRSRVLVTHRGVPFQKMWRTEELLLVYYHKNTKKSMFRQQKTTIFGGYKQ